MNRNIKTITKILLIILIAIAVLLILPKIDSAANSPVVGKDKDGKDVTIDELTRGSLLRGDWNNKGNVFDNKYVFCCERGQSLLRPNDSYAMFEVKKEIYMDEDGDLWAWNGNLNNDDAILISKNAQAYKFIQGLIYILSQEDPNAGKFYNATQCALWAYLQNYKDKDTYDGGSKTVFNFKDAKDITISETEKYIVAPDNTKYEIAYKWYKEAENICLGRSSILDDKKIKATIYKLEATGGEARQEILIAEKCDITKDEPPTFTLKFKKQDLATGGGLGNAKIQITKYDNTNNGNVKKFNGLGDDNCLTSALDGVFGTIKVPLKENNGKFSIYMEEIIAPGGYKLINGKVRIQVVYDTESKTINNVKITGNDNYNGKIKYEVNNKTATIIISNEKDKDNVPTTELLLRKTGLNDQPIADAKFDVWINNLSWSCWDGNQDNVNNGTVLTVSDYNGCYSGFQDNNDGSLNFHAWELDSGRDHSMNSDVIKFSNLRWADITKPITIKITEVKEPNGTNNYKYKKIQNQFTINIWPSDLTYNHYIKNEILDGYGNKVEAYRDNQANTTVIQVHNQPVIKLSGFVWQDMQSKYKDIKEPDGIYDARDDYNQDENGGPTYPALMGKIRVELYKAIDNTYMMYCETYDSQHSDGGVGSYYFDDVPYDPNGYYIKFCYDGIDYKTTKANANGGINDSKAIEEGRTTFNNRFKTIKHDRISYNNLIGKNIVYGKSNDETTIEYEEQKSLNNGSNINVLKFRTLEDGRNPANIVDDILYMPDYQMKAKTGVYKNTTTGINCGLIKKEVDLAINTSIESAKVQVNGKATTYNYKQIMDEGINVDRNFQEELNSPTYNLYLYYSDYHFRIKDYKTGNSAIENQVNTSDNNIVDNNENKELEVYLTYNVALKNETTTAARVDSFEYYYDSALSPCKINNTTVYRSSNNLAFGGAGDYVAEIDWNNNKIRFYTPGNKSNISYLEGSNSQQDIKIMFKVKKDNKNYVTLKDNIVNYAQIMSYSTREGGLIDRDSAPGNNLFSYGYDANLGYWRQAYTGTFEDDTSVSKGFNIRIKDQNDARKISGTVFDDKNANGIKDNGEETVNDVIVQLIEIKNISGKNYEYIWQETVSGSSQVKTTARDGYVGIVYGNSVSPGSGQYEFKGYIPGNYIIRYIYGDGTTYNLTDNVRKYNGQDYQSTKDEYCTNEWYNKKMCLPDDPTLNNNRYKENASVARDNPMRRYEVMAYSTVIDKDIDEALERRKKEDLQNTWMCAETSKINVPADGNLTLTENEVNVPYSTSQPPTVKFQNVNFGLKERPQVKITLEKHITGLKITPNGVGVQPIVDANVNISDIMNGRINPTGITTGLATIKSTRSNRGFWQVATDVEELTQGAELEVEYTYVIGYSGIVDRLPKNLVELYKQDPTTYSAQLKAKVKEIQDNNNNLKGQTNLYMNYLGDYYYLGSSVGDETPIRIEAGGLEEAISNNLKFDGNSVDFIKINGDKTVNKTIFDTSGNPKIEAIETVVRNKTPGEIIVTSGSDGINGKDVTKTIKLKTVLSSTTGGELGADIPSYLAEIIKYSSATGRRMTNSRLADLSYVHSDDTEMTLDNSWLYDIDGKTFEIQDRTKIPTGATNVRKANGDDEFWGETIIVTKPTGEDKLTPIQIVTITISGVAVLGVGILLIKKFIIK